jgi:hypothetical protein
MTVEETLDNCIERSETDLGSSLKYKEEFNFTGFGILSTD